MRLLRVVCLHLILLFFIHCQHRVDNYETVVFNQNKKAKWIQDNKDLPLSDSLFYLEDPAPLFRKSFYLKAPPKKATLHITAAGYYKAFVNNSELENNILDPTWTDYSKRIYFNEYDISSKLTEGNNCLGVVLGNGFFNPLPLKMWGRINLRERVTVGKPRFIAKIIITHQNDDIEEIVSDTSWKYSYGPIVKNSVYLGTHYDARKEIAGWNLASFDDAQWEK